MGLNPVSDVLDPVARRVKSRRDSLTEFHRPEFRTVGLEGWFKVEAVKALGKLVKRISSRGPDLELADGDSKVMIELKGAPDLNLSYLRDGATKYCGPEYPNFAGCLFLADGSDDSRTKKLSKGDFELQYRTIKDGEGTWIVGLLTSSTSCGRPTQVFRPPKALT